MSGLKLFALLVVVSVAATAFAAGVYLLYRDQQEKLVARERELAERERALAEQAERDRVAQEAKERAERELAAKAERERNAGNPSAGDARELATLNQMKQNLHQYTPGGVPPHVLPNLPNIMPSFDFNNLVTGPGLANLLPGFDPGAVPELPIPAIPAIPGLPFDPSGLLPGVGVGPQPGRELGLRSIGAAAKPVANPLPGLPLPVDPSDPFKGFVPKL